MSKKRNDKECRNEVSLPSLYKAKEKFLQKEPFKEKEERRIKQKQNVGF